MIQPYHFTRKGRSWSTLLAALAVWCLAVLGWLVLDASPVLVIVVLLLTLPAIWDVYSARLSGVSLTQTELRWFSGINTVTIPATEIDHVRLVTRLDLSVRAAVVLTSGRKLRMPAEATPPSKAFEDALTAHGIRNERHHFTFI
ncbi:MAG: hypothetical protein ABJL99_17400 [Aliishimia sp.]